MGNQQQQRRHRRRQQWGGVGRPSASISIAIPRAACSRALSTWLGAFWRPTRAIAFRTTISVVFISYSLIFSPFRCALLLARRLAPLVRLAPAGRRCDASEREPLAAHDGIRVAGAPPPVLLSRAPSAGALSCESFWQKHKASARARL